MKPLVHFLKKESQDTLSSFKENQGQSRVCKWLPSVWVRKTQINNNNNKKKNRQREKTCTAFLYIAWVEKETQETSNVAAPGRETGWLGVDCHCHLVTKSCLALFRPARLLCPWDSLGKNTGAGCHFLLQGIFPTQGLNLCLLHCRWILLPLSHQGSLGSGLKGDFYSAPSEFWTTWTSYQF